MAYVGTSGFSDEVLEEIRFGNDLAEVVGGYVALKQKGRDYWGCCPFHKEKSASFHVRADEQFYHCFGCGAGGNVYGFIMKIENIGFIDAVKLLAERIHYQLPEAGRGADYEKRKQERETLYALNQAAARFFYDSLQSGEGADAARYLDKRGVSPGARKRFGLGYAPGGDKLFRHLGESGHPPELLEKAGLVTRTEGGAWRDRFRGRLMFPIFDVNDKLTGFGGRVMGDGQPKYLNSPDTPVFDKSRSLYGLNHARRARAEHLLIVEGYMDVVALHQAGFTNAAAALGTAFNPNHARLISKYKKQVILLFDSDEAGEKAALRAIPMLTAAGLDTRVLRLDGAKDPDEFIKQYGKEAFAQALTDTAAHYAAFQIQTARKRFDVSKTVDKARFGQAAAEVIAALASPAERDAFITDVARESGLSASAVGAEVAKRLDKGREAVQPAAYEGKPAVNTGGAAAKADDEARRGVLAAMAKRGDLAAKITRAVAADAFVSPVYMKLFALLAEGGGNAFGASVANHFETPEEQQIVAAVFANAAEYESDADWTKALNEQIRRVKLAHINSRILSEQDAGALQRLLEARNAAQKAGFRYI